MQKELVTRINEKQLYGGSTPAEWRAVVERAVASGVMSYPENRRKPEPVRLMESKTITRARSLGISPEDYLARCRAEDRKRLEKRRAKV